MAGAFDKAEQWRRRAAELLSVAATMREPAARASLREIAASLERHADKLEEVSLKICRVQRRAARWRQAVPGASCVGTTIPA